MIVHGGVSLTLGALVLGDRQGRKILDAGHATFRSGERVMISGEMGAGRNVLARAILGFWPWGSGYLSVPAGYEAVIAHAAPYLPEGALEEAIQCPQPRGTFGSEDIADALSLCGLSHLVHRLAQKGRWMQTLSADEKQRCAIARLLLQKPGVIVLEDALSACDAGAQAELTRLVFERCKASVIIDISNRPGPAHLYDRTFVLTRSGDEPCKLEEMTRTGATSRLRSKRARVTSLT
jgi:putative ATP-binding cassette transporter